VLEAEAGRRKGRRTNRVKPDHRRGK